MIATTATDGAPAFSCNNCTDLDSKLKYYESKLSKTRFTLGNDYEEKETEVYNKEIKPLSVVISKIAGAFKRITAYLTEMEILTKEVVGVTCIGC